ncbi:PPE family protein [Mycobacterium avium]|uniref:PPE family protein n=1 Tax=Mycobacterium avium TaxID=1764 RepID=UPI0022AA9F3B|nr:PPE family protein [Mycobacterium avium]
MPPEVNTGRLIAGAMAEPYVQAQAAWQALAADFTAAMSMLTAEIATVSTLWQGMAAQQAQAAFAPYLAWMDSIVAMAQQRAAAAGAQAGAYSTAVVTTPTLAELAENHITHFILEMTNFLGVNTIPIAVNEFQYFVELWNRAAGAMDEYASATAVNTAFPPFPVAPPIMAMPGAPEAGLAAVLAQTAAALPNSLARDALLVALSGESAVEGPKGEAQLAAQVGGIAGNTAAGAAEQGTQDAESASLDTSGVASQSSPLVESASQIAMQAPQAVGELPQQLGQGPQALMSAASQPMQQLTSVFTQGLGSNLAGQGISQDQLLAHFGSVDQLGMYGTSPLGSAGGAYGGAGLLTSATSSTPLRTPAGWSAPAAPAAEEVAQVVSTTSTPGSGSGAVGTGTGMMGPLSAAHARSDGHTAVVASPAVEEKPVPATLGFEAFDDLDEI